MEETKKAKITRFDIYKNEQQIEEKLEDKYNHMMCHRMKERDTFKVIFPTTDLFTPDFMFTTTNNVTKASEFRDPYHDETYHLKADFNKRYYEEMARWKNMIKAKKTDETEKKK